MFTVQYELKSEIANDGDINGWAKNRESYLVEE